MTNRKELLKSGLVFFIFNTLIAILISFRYLKHLHFEGDFLSTFFIFGLILSHFFICSLLLFTIIYLPITLIFPVKKLLIWVVVILCTSLQFILILDTYTFDLYRFHISPFVLDLLFGGTANQIFEFHWIIYLISFFFFLALIIVEIIAVRFIYKKTYKFIYLKYILIVQISLWIVSNLIYSWSDAAFYKPVTSSARVFPMFMPLEASDFMYKHGIVSKEKSAYRLRIDDSSGKTINYPLNPVNTSLPEKPINILFIVIDSWNYRTLDSVTAPNIYKLAGSSCKFINHYSGSNGTRTGIFSLFYAIPGLYWYDFLDAQVSPILIDIFIQHKYKFAIFTSAGLHNPPFDRTIFRRVNSLFPKKKGNANERDVQITDEWLEFTAKNNITPFFGFLFYDSPHAIAHPANYKGPFQPEWQYAKYQELTNNSDPTPFFNLYRNTINYVDSLIGIIINDLKNRGMLNNTAIIITSDHGQEFNENKKNYWGHNGNYSRAQLGVPLVYHYPGVSPQIYNHWTSHYDIVPTILEDFFNCTNKPDEYSSGKNLKDTAQIDYLLVGSKDNFGIVEKDRITSIYYNRNYDITDQNLNPLSDAKIRNDLLKKILIQNNKFYRKTKH